MSTTERPPDVASSPLGSNRKVTRKDVALLAGVSDAVVSYTLNGGPPVAPATAARVREAVRVLGYRPNASARALKLGSAQMIGLVVPDSSNPFFAVLSHAVEDAAREQGYALLTAHSNDDKATTLQHVRSFASRQVDGVLIACPVDETEVPGFDSAGVRWAMIDQPASVDGGVSIGVDLIGGARIGVQHLVDHGYRSIAFVGDSRSTDHRRQGWLSTLADAGIAPGPAFASSYTREGGYAAGRAIAAMDDRPDAVFASSDMIATGVLRGLHEADVDIPGDVAIVSFDGSPETEYTWPALTAVRQPVQAMAADAVSQLVSPTPAAEHHRFECELLVRRSCGCAAP